MLGSDSPIRHLVGLLFVVVGALGPVAGAHAVTYAAVVMDARNGKVLHSTRASTILQPASLTKMMTLYVTFEAVENGEISLDTRVKISANAAREVPSKMHYKAGSQVKLRYLIRAAALRSANDAATAIAEAIEGSERAFTARMNRTAKLMGMKNTNFVNAHGLTEKGHYSTALDMSILGRHVIYDYPDYFHLFSKIKMTASGRDIYNTNRRFLQSYGGSDGIKTGFTNKSGYNLVATARRGNTRIITTVFGGRTAATRNAEVAKLMDIGFRKASTSAKLVKPKRPPYGQYVLNGKALAEMGAPLLRPEPDVPPPEEVVSVEHAETIFEDVLDDASPLVAEYGDTQEPISKEDETAGLLKPIPNRPMELTALHGLADLSRNAGVNLGLFWSTQHANTKSKRLEFMAPQELLSAKKQIVKLANGFELQYIWMTAAEANKVCETMKHRDVECEVLVFH